MSTNDGNDAVPREGQEPGCPDSPPGISSLEPAFHAIPDAIVLADEERRIIYVNPAFTALFGYDPEEVRGLPTKVIYVSEEAFEEQGRLRFNLSAEEKLRPYEVDYRKKNGEIFPSETVGTVVKGADGGFVGFLGIIRDISERKALEARLRETLASLEDRVRERTADLERSARALSAEVRVRAGTEEALRKSEEKFRSLFEAMNEGVAVHDLICDEAGKPVDYRIVDVNPAYEKILGIAATDAVGKLGTELYGSDAPPYLDVFGRVGLTGEPTYFETYFPPMDRHFSISVFSHRPRGFVTVFVDISPRRRDEEALTEAMNRIADEKARAESFLAAIGDGISIQDREFRVIYQNDTHRKMMGDQEGKHCYVGYEGRREVCDGCPIEKTFADGNIHTVERAVGDGPETRVYEITTSPLRGAEGEIVAGIEVVREVTARKVEQEEKLDLERQIQHVQKLESLGVLAGGIAHDFNNILMAILGNADLALARMSSSAPGRSNIQAIEKAARRAAELCQQMLAYSGKGKFVVESLDLSELVREMHHMLEVTVTKNAVLKYSLAGHLPRILADPTQIRQVVMNLIINASEAIGPDHGVISVATGVMDCDRSCIEETSSQGDFRAGRYAFVEVADTGCGMSGDVIQRLFEPFFTTKFTGRGLGMSAVLGIVRGHGGAIRVSSEVGRGTTMKVLLPVAEESAGDGERATQPRAQSIPWRGSGTILLVDDEDTVRLVAGEMLRHLGFHVLTATDGQDAVVVFRRHAAEIRCVILDLTMPRMGGKEAFRELRKIDPEVRVIMSSGYNEDEVARQFVGKGLAGFIQKPYQLIPLSFALQRAFEAGESSPGPG